MSDYDSSDYLASSDNTGYDPATDTMQDYGSTDYGSDFYNWISNPSGGSGGFTEMLKGLGNILKGTSDYGVAGQIAGLGGMGYLLNKLLGGGGGGYAGYQGGIPTLTASRQMLPIPQTVTNAQGQTVPRRPGSGGITYFSPMVYTAAPPPAESGAPPANPPANPPAEQASTGGKATAQGANTNTNTNTASPTYTHPSTLVAGSPGSEYQPFEGWSEYFDPTGAYRRFSSTGTPITPMKFGTSAGNIAGQAVSPYSVPYSVLGFTPDKAGYDARLAADAATVKKADGGLLGLARGGRFLRGGGDGVSDSIPAKFAETGKPARLADGEFVLDARTVSEIGNGSSEAGARKLYAFMKAVHGARKKAGRGSKSGADKHLQKLLA